MGKTTIGWTDFTVNPIRARDRATGRKGHWCEKVSPGCTHCYASAWQKFRGQGHPFEVPYRDQVEVYFEPRALTEVLTRRIPTRYFWLDMSDLFGAWVLDAWIDQCVATMALTPHHTHLVLTKRAERMFEYFTGAGHVQTWNVHPVLGPAEGEDGRLTDIRCAITSLGGAEGYNRIGGLRWPLPNLHLGVSVENQEQADKRTPRLLQTPAVVRWLSVEPLLGPVNLTDRPWPWPDGPIDLLNRGWCNRQTTPLSWNKLDWIVVGGESGPGHRPMDLAWLRDVVAQCRAAGVACYVKQDSGPRPGHQGRIPAELWALKEFPERR